MDRQLIYPGAIPLETDLLNTNKNMMIGLSKLAAAVFGTSTLINGLACTPTGPASLQVYVAPGEIYALANIDGTAYSSIAADTTRSILKQGVLLDQVTLSCPAPASAGNSINYLVQVAYLDSDTDAVVLPYYNASNPAQAYSGPANAGTANYTARRGICVVSVKAGVSATTGSQVTPSPDVNYVGAWVVTVANGQTQITSPNIVQYGSAPFISETLTQKISQATADLRYLRIGASALPAGVVPKYTVANNGTTSLDIGAIAIRSDDNTTNISVAALTKSLSGTWVAGNAQNAMDTGTATANGTLHVYAIWNQTTSTGDFLFSASASAPTLPAGYTKKVYLFSLRLNASTQFIPFSYRGSDTFVFTTSVLDMNLASVTTTASLVVLSVPTGIQVEAHGRMTIGGTSTSQTAVAVTSPDESDQVPNSGFGDLEITTTGTAVQAAVRRRTDTAGRLRFRSTAAANTQINFNTSGYTILR